MHRWQRHVRPAVRLSPPGHAAHERPGVAMTLDQAVALSLLEHLSRIDLTARLTGSDPELLESAAPLVERARHVREHAARHGIHVVPWNDARMPASLLAIPDCPPALWYRGSLDCFDAPAIAIVGSRHASS